MKLPSANKSYGDFHTGTLYHETKEPAECRPYEVLFIGHAIIENKAIHKRHTF